MVVTPPATADADSRSASSGSFGTRMSFPRWACGSIAPGSTVAPRRSTSSLASAAAPGDTIPAIRPSLISRSALVRPESCRNTLPLRRRRSKCASVIVCLLRILCRVLSFQLVEERLAYELLTVEPVDHQVLGLDRVTLFGEVVEDAPHAHDGPPHGRVGVEADGVAEFGQLI